MVGVDQVQNHNEERALMHTAVETARKERTYEQMKPNFDTHQFVKSVSDDKVISNL